MFNENNIAVITVVSGIVLIILITTIAGSMKKYDQARIAIEAAKNNCDVRIDNSRNQVIIDCPPKEPETP